mmetsp:Transcript_27626/g.55793  ORF Transcript_27626/g.55793 Transcript_27626/m.55793 type:complete len:206 (+) Transcript_27626:271-888(+)
MRKARPTAAAKRARRFSRLPWLTRRGRRGALQEGPPRRNPKLTRRRRKRRILHHLRRLPQPLDLVASARLSFETIWWPNFIPTFLRQRMMTLSADPRQGRAEAQQPASHHRAGGERSAPLPQMMIAVNSQRCPPLPRSRRKSLAKTLKTRKVRMRWTLKRKKSRSDFPRKRGAVAGTQEARRRPRSRKRQIVARRPRVWQNPSSQ